MSGTLIQIGLVILGLLGLGGMFLKNQRDQRKAGEDKERAAGLAQQTVKVTDANQARAGVAGASDDDLDDRLRPPGARRGH